MPSGLSYAWEVLGGLLQRRGHTSGGTGGGPNLDPLFVAGSAVPGTTNYPIPGGALFVDPNVGSDSNPGTIGSPFRTVQHAFGVVPVNGTIVMRAGTYHEGVVGTASTYAGIPLQTAGVTLQAYPNEAVWLDGSSVVTGWVLESAGLWRKDNWTLALDRSPTYTFGVADDPRPGWSFINPAYPTAAWPERVFINGVALQQVNSKAGVTAGKFFIDQGAHQVYVGTDPTTLETRITDLQTTWTGLAVGVTFRGFGVRRFAPSQPHLGCMKMLRSNCVMENLWFEDISCVGIAFQGSSNGIGANQVMRNCTMKRIGSVGCSVTSSDNITISRVDISGCNVDHFNYAPATGGIKATRLIGITVKESLLSNNNCKGLWMDESVAQVFVYTNDFVNNAQRGVTFELCGVVTFANNLVVHSGYNGVDHINNDGVIFWNNTIVNAGAQPDVFGANWNDARLLDAIQDSRAPMNASSVGLDPRQPFPRPDGMDWIIKQIQLKNNIFSKLTVGQALTGVEDYRHSSGIGRSWQQMGVDFDGNVYNRLAGPYPSWFSLLPNAGSANPTVFFDINGLKALGVDTNSRGIDGANALNSDYTLQSTYLAAAEAAARPLPSSIAALIGKPAGIMHAGCWR